MVMVMVIVKMMPIVKYLAEKPASFPRQRTTKDPDKLLSVQEGTLETHRREAKPNEQQVRRELKGQKWGTSESREKHSNLLSHSKFWIAICDLGNTKSNNQKTTKWVYC